MNEFTLEKNERSIWVREWKVDKPTAYIFISHGLGEHGGRYNELALHFNGLGYTVVAHDHFGHGKSSGKYGHVEHFNVYSDDLNTVVNHYSTDLPKYLLGHSLGAVIASGYETRYPGTIKKLILTSPGFEKKVPPNAIKAGLGKLLANIAPKLTLWNEIKPEMVCRTPEIINAYSTDKLVHDRVSAKFFTSFLNEIDYLKTHIPKINIPLLMLISGSDLIIDHTVSKTYYDLFSSSEKKWVEYPEAYHEVLNEENEKTLAFKEIEEWLT